MYAKKLVGGLQELTKRERESIFVAEPLDDHDSHPPLLCKAVSRLLAPQMSIKWPVPNEMHASANRAVALDGPVFDEVWKPNCWGLRAESVPRWLRPIH